MIVETDNEADTRQVFQRARNGEWFIVSMATSKRGNAAYTFNVVKREPAQPDLPGCDMASRTPEPSNVTTKAQTSQEGGNA
jgi:hypothetical protein